MEEAGSMEEAGHEDSSHNILTLDALQVLSRSQVTLELSMSMRIRPICKSLHTYIGKLCRTCRMFWLQVTRFCRQSPTNDQRNWHQGRIGAVRLAYAGVPMCSCHVCINCRQRCNHWNVRSKMARTIPGLLQDKWFLNITQLLGPCMCIQKEQFLYLQILILMPCYHRPYRVVK
jgi:hypothetical protein